MKITFAEIIEYDPTTGAPLERTPETQELATQEVPKTGLTQEYVAPPQPAPKPQRSRPSSEIDDMENEPGVGFLSPDGKTVIGMWSARRDLFWKTFGENQQSFMNRTGLWYDEALLAVGFIFVNQAQVQVGMRGRDTLSAEQYRAIIGYFQTHLAPNKPVSVSGVWYDPQSYAFQREQVLYQGPANKFHQAGGGYTDVSTTTKGYPPSAVNYQYKAGALNVTFDYEWSRLADFVDEMANQNVIRAREQAKRRERIKNNRENIKLLSYDHYGLPIIQWDGEEWALATDEMADHAAEEAAASSLDEGLFSTGWLSYHIDGDQVAHDYADDYDRYREDAKQELEAEAEENPDEEGNVKEVTEQEIETKAEEKQQEHYNEIKNDPLDYLKQFFQEGEELGKVINKYVDRKEVLEAAVNEDGRGHFISGYDSDEHDLDRLDGMEVINLPDDVIEELGINRRYRYQIYAYRIN